MVKQFTSRSNSQFIILVGYLLLAMVIWLGLMSEFRLDDSFITYRYARNLAHGVGLVYNSGDAILSTTAPLYAILLGGLSLIIPDFHFLGSIIGTLSIGLGGWLIYELLPKHISISIRIWAGAVYVLSSAFWLSLGMETSLWVMLVLAGVVLARREHWAIAGLVIGLAVLTRPDAALAGGLLGLLALGTTVNRLNTQTGWWRPVVRFTVALIIPIVLFALWALTTYGSVFPVTLGAKSAQALLGISGLGVNIDYLEGAKLIIRSLMSQSSLYIALALLVLFGLAGSLNGAVLLVVLWGVLHLVGYVVLKVAPYRWYYVPLMPSIILLAALGLDYIRLRLAAKRYQFALILAGLIAVFPLIAEINSLSRINEQIRNGGPTDVMLPIVDWQAYRQTGEWLDAETPPDATVGVAEVGQLGFYANRWMTDYLGLLQPDVTAMLKRGDFYSWLVDYAPDYLVFQRFRGAALVLYNYVIQNDPWFNANYQPTVEFDDPRYASGPVTIFKRVLAKGEWQGQPLQEEFGGLRLVGYAVDMKALTVNGGTVRVRLDWEKVGSLPRDLHIAVKGLELAGGNPAYDGDYQTANWSGTFSTWHGFAVPEGVKPGSYTLLVAVGPTGGPYQEAGVGHLSVSDS